MSPSRKKRLRPLPGDKSKRLNDVYKRAKSTALTMLIESLQFYDLQSNGDHTIITDVANALELDSPVALDGTFNPENKRAKMISRGNNKKTSSDDHNETCEVCDKGGDLLCCDTCSLVFHLKCVRPKISEVPKGTWNCPHCIDDGTAVGDVEMARRALLSMSRLRKVGGVDSSTLATPLDPKELTIVRMGRRVVLRQESTEESGRKIITDLGRYSSVEKALSAMHRLVQGEDGDGDGSKGEDEHVDHHRRGSSSHVTKEDDGEDGEEEDGLWCAMCLDDSRIQLCAFCGCRTCFGKQDSDYLLLCDGCDVEFHLYCMDPPLTEVPRGQWFCANCDAEQEPMVGEEGMEEESSVEEVVDSDNSQSVRKYKTKSSVAKSKSKTVKSEGTGTGAGTGATEPVVVRRGRGRPPGRRNKDTQLKEAAAAAAEMETDGSYFCERNRERMDRVRTASVTCIPLNTVLSAVMRLAAEPSPSPSDLSILSTHRQSEDTPLVDLVSVLEVLIAQKSIISDRFNKCVSEPVCE